MCIQILEVIETLRVAYTEPHPIQSPPIGLIHLADVASKCLTLLKDMNSLPEENSVFFKAHEEDITACLVMLRDILAICREKSANHFGTFEVTSNCVMLLHAIL